MKITIDTETLTADEIDWLTALLARLRAEGIAQKKVEPSNEPVLREITDAEVDRLLIVMYDYALKQVLGTTFITPDLYGAATGQQWEELSPNTRKAIGRRFKKLTDERLELAEGKARVVVLNGKTVQNTAIYELRTKIDEWDLL